MADRQAAAKERATISSAVKLVALGLGEDACDPAFGVGALLSQCDERGDGVLGGARGRDGCGAWLDGRARGDERIDLAMEFGDDGLGERLPISGRVCSDFALRVAIHEAMSAGGCHGPHGAPLAQPFDGGEDIEEGAIGGGGEAEQTWDERGALVLGFEVEFAEDGEGVAHLGGEARGPVGGDEDLDLEGGVEGCLEPAWAEDRGLGVEIGECAGDAADHASGLPCGTCGVPVTITGRGCS